MATTPAADARASSHDRIPWVVTAAAVAVLVLGFVLHSVLTGRESVEQQIGEQVYAETGCLTKVSSNQIVARRWPEASKAEIIVCQTSETDEFPNEIMDYAQFASASALSATLKTAPPDGTYCTIKSSVVSAFGAFDDLRNSFAAMCANRGGTLHEGAAG
jgi:hypothetical protein